MCTLNNTWGGSLSVLDINNRLIWVISLIKLTFVDIPHTQMVTQTTHTGGGGGGGGIDWAYSVPLFTLKSAPPIFYIYM